MNNIFDVCEKILYSEQDIAQRCAEIGKQIYAVELLTCSPKDGQYIQKSVE